MTAATLPRSRALTPRDLINTGVFSAVYFVIMFGFGMLGFLNPVMSLVGFILAILANGVVTALYVARVPRVGALTLMMLIVSALMVLTGHAWFTLAIGPLLGLAADLILASGRRSPWRFPLAYAVLSLWYLGPLLPAVWDTVGYREYIASAMGAEYAEGYMALFSPTNLVFIGALMFVTALVGGWFGRRTLDRHFRRAGVA